MVTQNVVNIMIFTAKQIAEIVNGEIIGNPDVTFSGFSKIEDTREKTISFLSNKKYADYLTEVKSEALIISRDLVPDFQCNTTLIVVEDAHQAFVVLMRMYASLNKTEMSGLSSNSIIHGNALIGQDCYIGDYAVIMGNASIGDRCKIYPHVYIGANVSIGNDTILMPGVKIYDNCNIGANCLIHAGTVIGADGFGFTQENGENVKVPQLGNVIVGDNVEMGANCTIDKATLGSTIIHDDVKFDNLVHIAHNAEIGAHTVIAAQTVVGGSTKIGHNCLIGGQVGFIDHITVGNNVKVISQSGIMRNIGDNEIIMGAPAFDFSSFKRSYACFRNLPEKLKNLENATKNNK